MPATGQSALVLPVSAAEPLVGAWRSRHDDSAGAGMPAHVTVLAPFLPASELGEPTVARLGEICSAHAAIEVDFTHSARFPGVLHLAPEPPQEIVALTEAVFAAWPQTPPYEGLFDEIVPHLTVAHSVGEQVMAEIEQQIAAGLPFHARLDRAVLFVYDEAGRWAERAAFPLARATATRIRSRS